MRPATVEQVELIVSERIADLERRLAPEALNVRDVAQRLRLSVTRVNELIYSNALPSYTIGRARRVDPSDLAAFIEDRRRASTHQATSTAMPQPAITGRSWLEDFRREAYGGR